MTKIKTDTTMLYMPTLEDIRELKVGSMVPNCFGTHSIVTEIFARGTDTEGRAFVCLYAEDPRGLTMSESFKEDTIHRNLLACKFFNSLNLDLIERAERAVRARMRQVEGPAGI